MTEGLLLVNKEKGVSSFFLVKLLRKISNVKKIGHAGTLDPLATGLMLLLIGKNYTRKADAFINFDKEYLATIKLGEKTDTYDQEGKVLQTSVKVPTLEEILEKLKLFQGKINQIPPAFSAKKHQGKKLYELARKGIMLELKPSLVELNTTLLSYEYPFLTLKVACSKGTYIRSLAHDLGEALGSLAHLYELERTRVGPYLIQDALSQKNLSDDNDWKKHLRKL